MRSYVILPRAEADIDQIYTYISTDSLFHANNWLDSLYRTFNLLTEFPKIGTTRIDLNQANLRFWPMRRYLILYRPSTPLIIVRVMSAYRNLPELLI